MGERRGCSRGGATARAAVISAVMSAVVVIAGCSSGGGSAAPFPTSSPSAKPTPKATTATQQVESTVRAYYAAVERAVATGDLDDFRALTEPACSCRMLVSRVEGIYRGGSAAGVAIRVMKVHDTQTSGSQATAGADYHSQSYTIRRPGKTHVPVPARSGHDVLSLNRHGGEWLVADVVDIDR